MFLISTRLQQNQHKVIGRILLEFKGDIEYLTSNNSVTADGSSHSSNEAFMFKL